MDPELRRVLDRWTVAEDEDDNAVTELITGAKLSSLMEDFDSDGPVTELMPGRDALRALYGDDDDTTDPGHDDRPLLSFADEEDQAVLVDLSAQTAIGPGADETLIRDTRPPVPPEPPPASHLDVDPYPLYASLDPIAFDPPLAHSVAVDLEDEEEEMNAASVFFMAASLTILALLGILATGLMFLVI